MTTTATQPAAPVHLRAARRWVATPGLAAFMAFPALRRSPYPAYRLFQRLEPVHHSPFGLWFLSRHEDVAAALRHPQLGSDEHAANLDYLKVLNRAAKLLSRGSAFPVEQSSLYRMASDWMLFKDPPDHTRLRSLVGRAFNPRIAEELGPTIQGVIDDLLDPLVARGRMELLSD